MKVIQCKDYELESVVGYWYQFRNKHYDGLDSERLLVKRAKLVLEDGRYVYLDPIEKSYVKNPQAMRRMKAYLTRMIEQPASVVEGE